MLKNLKSAILDADDSIAAFANHQNFSEHFIRDLISERKSPSKATIDALIMATGKTYEYLFEVRPKGGCDDEMGRQEKY